MKRSKLWLVLLALAVFAGRALAVQTSDDTAILWNNAAIDAARDSDSGSLAMVRALAIMHTAMFDAWSQYDTTARPTLGRQLRRPASERTIQNQREAVSYAAYWVLVDLFPSDTTPFNVLMILRGYDPAIQSQDPATPAGIGLRAAGEVLEYRHHDGANQLGDLHSGAYSDYTSYSPANAPDKIQDPDRWPLREDRNGKSSSQVFCMPQWGLVQPFGIDGVRPATANGT